MSETNLRDENPENSAENVSQPVQPTQQPPVYPNPEPNRQHPPIKPGYAEVKKVQNLALAASICGPVSVFIGGMLLSGVGIVCGFLGMRRADRIENGDKEVKEAATRARRSCVVALIVCAVAFALNAAYSFYMYPIIMDAVQTGDLSALMGNAASSGSVAGSGSGSSTWG